MTWDDNWNIAKSNSDTRCQSCVLHLQLSPCTISHHAFRISSRQWWPRRGNIFCQWLQLHQQQFFRLGKWTCTVSHSFPAKFYGSQRILTKPRSWEPVSLSSRPPFTWTGASSMVITRQSSHSRVCCRQVCWIWALSPWPSDDLEGQRGELFHFWYVYYL